MEYINTFILCVMMAFMVIGAIGRILKQWDFPQHFAAKRGWSRFYHALAQAGVEFENGFMAMGPLGLAMIGVIALAPILAKLLGFAVIPLYELIGASPAMFATTLLANDMGGYFLAKELATTDGVVDHAAWLYSGLILGSMLGATIAFTIPVAINIINVEDRRFFALGVLAGMVTIPIGCLAGGIVARYSNIMVNGVPVEFSFQMLLLNLIPVSVIALLVILGLWAFPEGMIKGFQIFAKVIVTIITVGLALAVLSSVLNLNIIPGMDPIFMVPGDKPGHIMRAVEVVGYISCILLGAYPMVYFLTLWFEKPLLKLGHFLKIDGYSAAGMIASLANAIPMLGMMKDMGNRGKIINIAFCVSAGYTFGDHLGFTGANMPGMIFAVTIGKLTGGITAIYVALFLISKKGIQNAKE